MKKVVLKVELHDDRIKQKAMKAVSGISGVESVSVDMKDNKLTLTGDIDPVGIVGKLRKICHTHIVSVGPAKEEKKEEPKKAEAKKGEDDKKPEIKLVPYDHVYGYNYNYNYYPMRPHQYYYARTVEEDPNACVIC